MSKHRCRRLRKKLHVGEFRELGFSIDVNLVSGSTEAGREAFVNALLEEIIEPRELAYGGGADGGYICKLGRGSAVENDRHRVIEWMNSRSDVTSVVVGELDDAWHGKRYASGKS